MDKNKIAKQLSDILPDRSSIPGVTSPSAKDLVNDEASRIKTKQNARELARIKFAEKQKLNKLKAQEEKRVQLAKELGVDEIPEGQTLNQAKKLAEQKKRVEAIEAIEAQAVEPLSPTDIADNTPSPMSPRNGVYSSNVTKALRLQGASKSEITKLLTSLDINLSVQLTKHDTANLLACLLTCNESQLDALYSNKKIPVAIKTVIKRLIDDSRLGNMETIEKLWDRIFGKGQMQLDLPEQQQLQTGIIPNVPISREAYVIIRDTLMK